MVYSTVRYYFARGNQMSFQRQTWQGHFKPAVSLHRSWMDSVIIHVGHLVIPSVTFLFPLSQLLPVLPINLQCQLQFTMTLSGMSPLFHLGCWWALGPSSFLLIPPHLEMHLCSDRDSTTLRCGSGIWLHLTKIAFTQIVGPACSFHYFCLLLHIISVFFTIFCGCLFIGVKVFYSFCIKKRNSPHEAAWK